MRMNINFPPGFWHNGTQLQATGRWFEGRHIRWEGGVLQPILGWVERLNMGAIGTASGCHAWLDNTGTTYIVVGTEQGLWLADQDDTTDDISPAGWVDGRPGDAANPGYGGGPYSEGDYGVGAIGDVSILPADSWSMDNWGEDLVAAYTGHGYPIAWSPGDLLAVNIPNAPSCDAIVVTEERFLFALGADGDPRLLKWSDREDRETWTPVATNEAGDNYFSTSTKLMCAVRSRGEVLILTDVEAFSARYIGPPFVYGFERVGSNCGIVSRRGAAPIANGGVVWLGKTGFFIYQGGSVSPLPCDVLDYIFGVNAIGQSNGGAQTTDFAFTNVKHNEVWWYFNGGANYVAWDYEQNIWLCGATSRRCAAFDGGVLTNHIAVTHPSSGAASAISLMEHEVLYDYSELTGSGQQLTPYATSGYMLLGDGERAMQVRRVYPDGGSYIIDWTTYSGYWVLNGSFVIGAGVGGNMPGIGSDSVIGEGAMGGVFDVRGAARMVSVTVSGNDDHESTDVSNATWTFGGLILDVVPGGLR